MIPFKISTLLKVTQGKILLQSAKTSQDYSSQLLNASEFVEKYPEQNSFLSTYSTDTRENVKDQAIFIVLPLTNYSVEFICEQAVSKGYKNILTYEIPQALVGKANFILVPSTEHAIQQLGAYQRDNSDALFIAITGSCGKTSVKELLNTIFQKHSEYEGLDNQAVLATKGSLNNHLGVPLTLLNLTPASKYAIIEIGANHLGEIDHLSKLVRPHIACINNIYPAHTKGFGSIFNVAVAKSEIFNHLEPGGIRIVNLDSYCNDLMLSKPDDQTLVTISQEQNIANFYIDPTSIKATMDDLKFEITVNGGIDQNLSPALQKLIHKYKNEIFPVNTSLVGVHNVYNIAVALAIATYCNIPLTQSLLYLSKASSLTPQSRNFINNCGAGKILIDDTFNANPGSVNALIETLKLYNFDHRILVLGQLAEINDEDLIEFYTKLYRETELEHQYKLIILGSFTDQVPQNLTLGSKVLQLPQVNKYLIFEPYSVEALQAKVEDYLAAQNISTQSLDQATTVIGFKGSHSSQVKKIYDYYAKLFKTNK